MRVFGVAVGLVVMSATGAVACGGTAGSITNPITRPSVAPPTADANVARVRTVTEAFVHAEIGSAKSGDVYAADRYIIVGAPALGNTGASAELSAETGKTFVATRVDFVEPAPMVIAGSTATADLTYSLQGHEVAWPSLRALAPDGTRGPLHMHIDLRRQGDSWLVFAFSS